MNPFDPILDQPQIIDAAEMHPDATTRLANQEIVFHVDAATDLLDLEWPWAGARYVKSIRLRITDAHSEGLMAMVTRYYAGYQEVILGSEGVIISKRLTAPLASSYDRAVLWMLDCQAEGDRLLRLDVSIDWGEPLTQRMVDGLLVAQRNPGRAQGIYAQQNAESTRVFGNPHGRPSTVNLDDDEGRAELVYYVLVNGMVEVPLVLTVSDVGEQMAWNGFLALRDAERVFELSVDAWSKLTKSGRLWTSDPQLNRAVQAGRLETARSVQRLRTGYAPAGRRVEDAPALVRSLDTYDVTQSRNVLAHLRRAAENTAGRLPVLLPLRPKEAADDPGPVVARTNRAYIAALYQHLQRHPNDDLLAEHYVAIQLCSETLVKLRQQENVDVALQAAGAAALRTAVVLATSQRDSVNAVRWESEACDLEDALIEAGAQKFAEPQIDLDDWEAQTGWTLHADRPWGFADPMRGVILAGEAVWRGCGLLWRGEKLGVYPMRDNSWRWWALLGLPIGDASGPGTVSIVWDGETVHATQPVQSDCPVQVWDRIRALHTDELDFDLQFEMTPIVPHGTSHEIVPHGTSHEVEGSKHIFQPVFDKE